MGVQSVFLLSRRLVPQSVQQNGSGCSRLAATGAVFLIPCFIVFVLQWIPSIGCVGWFVGWEFVPDLALPVHWCKQPSLPL